MYLWSHRKALFVLWFLCLFSENFEIDFTFFEISLYSVQSVSLVQLSVTLWTAACQASVYIRNSWNLLKPMSIELVMPSNHLNLCHPLLLPPSIFLNIRGFSNESPLRIRWPQVLEFQLQHQSFQWIFRTDFL